MAKERERFRGNTTGDPSTDFTNNLQVLSCMPVFGEGAKIFALKGIERRLNFEQVLRDSGAKEIDGDLVLKAEDFVIEISADGIKHRIIPKENSYRLKGGSKEIEIETKEEK